MGGMLGSLWGRIAKLSSTESAFIDDVTPGTAAASKAVVLDSSSKIDTLDITTPKFNGTAVSATAGQLNKVAVTAGTAAASKAVVLGPDGKIDTMDITSPKFNGVTLNTTAGVLNKFSGGATSAAITASATGSTTDANTALIGIIDALKAIKIMV